MLDMGQENLDQIKEEQKIVPVPETKLEDFLAVVHFMMHLTSAASVLQLLGGEAKLAEIVRALAMKSAMKK